MADEKPTPKFNPKTAYKDLMRVIEEAPRCVYAPGNPNASHLPPLPQERFRPKRDVPWEQVPALGKTSGYTPGDEEKQRRIEAMRKALLESEQKERQILRERQIEPEKPSPDGSLP